MKAATQAEGCANRESLFQSTPPVKAATYDYRMRNGLSLISIHAAREGGDAQHEVFAELVAISIHAAREGGDGGNE